MNTYTIEYELRAEGSAGGPPVYGCASYAAENAHGAIEQFDKEFPGAEMRELRRDHVR